MKKLLAILSAAPMGLLAAENGGAAYTGSVAETIVNDASSTMTNFLTGAAPVIATIIGAGLAIWAGIRLVGILKSAFSAGKGR